MTNQPLKELQVLGIRYTSTRPALGDDRSLDAYTASGVYSTASVPYQIIEPSYAYDPQESQADKPQNLGRLGGVIAQAVASAQEQGQAVLMTGGDCSHITGVVGGLQSAHGPQARIGLVWFDAHGDFNTPQITLSGMLGGMPVAVCAGLAFPEWREGSHVVAPLPTDRILMVDVRNLDPAEETLINAVGIPIAAPAEGFPGEDLATAVNNLAENCDLLYLHIDSDILDARYVPNHSTGEPNGPDMAQVQAAINTVMATGKVAAFAVVSVYGEGEGSETTVASGIELIQTGLQAWQKYGLPVAPLR